MAATSYYDEPGMTQGKPQILPENTHIESHEKQSKGLGQEMNSEARGFPQQGYNQGYNEQSSGMTNGQQQQNMGQQHMGNNSYGQGAPQQMHGQNNGVYSGQQQQNMGSSNYAQGAGQQQMNGGMGQAAEPDNRDTITKCNDNLPDYIGELETSLPSSAH